MGYKPASAGSEIPLSGEGLCGKDKQQGELRDERRGAYDNVAPLPHEPLREHVTPHERAQRGSAVQPYTEPRDESVPEGLRREPAHPINPGTGRGNGGA